MVDRPDGEVEITPEFLFIQQSVFVQRPAGENQQRPGGPKKFVWEAADYALVPTKDLKWIDLGFAGKSVGSGFGVYELAGDTLRISYRLSVPRVFRTLEFRAGIE